MLPLTNNNILDQLEEQIICLDGVILLPHVSLSAQNMDLLQSETGERSVGTEHNGDSHPSPLLNLTRWASKPCLRLPFCFCKGTEWLGTTFRMISSCCKMLLFLRERSVSGRERLFKNHTVSRRRGNGGQDTPTSATEPGRVYLPVTLKCLEMLAGKHRSVLISPSAISLYMLTYLSPVDSHHVPFAHCETTTLLLLV